MKRRQRGVALITVLLVMSVALVLTSSLLRSHRLMVQSGAQHLHHMQLRQISQSAETLARQYLHNPQLEKSKNINLAQEWARPDIVFQFEGAHVHIAIEDLAGRFNINQLLKPGQVDALTLARWTRLLGGLNLQVPDLTLLRPYSNTALISDISELRRLPGVNRQWLERLRPWVAVLPRDAALNINTASATVLSALEGMTPSSGKTIVEQRPAAGFSSVQAFTQAPPIAGLGVTSHGLAISSRWFRVKVDVEWGELRLRQISDFEKERGSGRLRMLHRSYVAFNNEG